MLRLTTNIRSPATFFRAMRKSPPGTMLGSLAPSGRNRRNGITHPPAAACDVQRCELAGGAGAIVERAKCNLGSERVTASGPGFVTSAAATLRRQATFFAPAQPRCWRSGRGTPEGRMDLRTVCTASITQMHSSGD